MAPKNKALAQKLATLRLPLAPLVPLPDGSPHAAFPRTLLAYHILTEEQLDSIAHYYHQSTPGFWTNQYPECMNWDKAFLNASKEASERGRQDALRRLSLPGGSSIAVGSSAEGGATTEEEWWNNIMDFERASAAACGSVSPKATSPATVVTPPQSRRWSASQMSTQDRVAIKRRKVGKFIGLLGMHTPIEEVEGRIRWYLERAIRVAREESRAVQERELAGRKV